MASNMMRSFSKSLRRGEMETLFQLQVDASVSCSECLMFEKVWVENPIGSSQRQYYVGLYRNSYPDSFVILYKDINKRYPRDFIWLKECLVTSHKYVSEDTISIHCGNKTILFRFDSRETRISWQTGIRTEILFLEANRSRSSSNSSVEEPTTEQQNYWTEKHTCLRKTNRTNKPDVHNVFKEKKIVRFALS